MSNSIVLADRAGKEIDSLHLSNGATSVLIETLVLAGASLAKTLEDRRLFAFFASRDQARRGSGFVGFDFDDIPWHGPSFAAQKALVLAAARLALTRHGFERLSYDPPQERLEPNLLAFISLLERYELHPEDAEYEVSSVRAADDLCPVHGVVQYQFDGEGPECVICNAG